MKRIDTREPVTDLWVSVSTFSPALLPVKAADLHMRGACMHGMVLCGSPACCMRTALHFKTHYVHVHINKVEGVYHGIDATQHHRLQCIP